MFFNKTIRFFCLFISMLLSISVLNAQEKPEIMLMKVQDNTNEAATDEDIDHRIESFTLALEKGLAERYTVISGESVEEAVNRNLEAAFSNQDKSIAECTEDACAAAAVEIGVLLIADASVKKFGDAYNLRLVVREVTDAMKTNVILKEEIDCRDCDFIALKDKFVALGRGELTQDSGSESTPLQSKAILIFDSVPSNAQVFINGQPEGSTPYQGTGHLLGDKLAVSLVAEDHAPHQFNVELSDFITQLEPITLTPLQPAITQPQDSVVFVFTKPEGSNLIFKGASQKGINPNEQDLFLKKGSNKFTLVLSNGRKVYGNIELLFVSDEIKEATFGTNKPLPKPQHIQGAMRGSPVRYSIKANVGGIKEVIKYRLSLRPL
jgi:hypothetical protein